MLAPWAETIDAPHTATTVRAGPVEGLDIAADGEYAIVVTGELAGHAQGRGNDIAISIDDMGAAQRRRNDEVVVSAVDVGAEYG